MVHIRPMSSLRKGPHEDIDLCCEFKSDFSDDWDPSTAVTAEEFVKAALIAGSVEERVCAARKALELTCEKCGVAWLVLAREGSHKQDELEKCLGTAVQQLKQESASKEECYGCLPDDDAYALAVADLAQVHWNTNKRTEAIDLLTLCLTEREGRLWYEAMTVVVDLAASFLVQLGKMDEAKALLHNHPQESAEWHYLNALVQFSILGDSMVSRSALILALLRGTTTADRLLNGSGSMFAPTLEAEAFGQNRYIEDTEPAWRSAPTALEWLGRIYKDPLSRHNRDREEIAVLHNDQHRWRRWKDQFDKADHYLGQNNLREAKKSFKTALREAERIDYSKGPFSDTMTALIDLADQTNEPVADLRAHLDSRIKRFESDPEASPIHTFHFQSFGRLFQFMDDYQTATKHYDKALQLLDHHVRNGSEFLTLLDIEDATFDLAFCFCELEQYSAALPLLLRTLEASDSYLGSKHDRSLEVLGMAYKCAQNTGDYERVQTIRERILLIDESYLDDLLTSAADSCDSCGMDHH